MRIGHAVTRAGFDPARLGFTLRTALAAGCAVLAAWMIGLEHPQWAGMTVWAASQPVRGHLLEKSLFRVLGTILGALFGIGLVAAAQGQAWIIVLGLSAWVGLCVGAGNLLRGFVSYGVLLAGYSAAMVTLLHSAQPDGTLAVGIDRMLTVLVGVAVALAVGLLFAARRDHDSLARRVDRLSGRVLALLAAHLAEAAVPGEREYQFLLAELAAMEEELDGHAAGSLHFRAAVRTLRRRLAAQVAALLWMRRAPPPGAWGPLVAALEAAAVDLERPGTGGEDALLRAVGLAASDPALREVIAGLSLARSGQSGDLEAADALPLIALHRDWIGAREAMLRAGGVTLAAGLAWLATGWSAGPLLMLGTAIMTTVFSTFDNPVQTMRSVLVGQVLGVAGALACRWLVWPHAGGELGLILWMMPFILVGAFLFAHPRTAAVGFDYNMVLLLLLQPLWPLGGTLEASITAAVAVLLGPVIALLAYRLVFPISGRKRLQMLRTMMVREVEEMAGRPDAAWRPPVWRARLYHRVLRLARWAEKTGHGQAEVIDGGLAVLLAGSAALHLGEALRAPDLAPGTARRLTAALARLRDAGADPRRAARALSAAARAPGIDPDLLLEAAGALADRGAFFAAAGPRRVMG
ncbi:FUSC family protein [Azorhizobium doebereinerae]|uniref:FUSC family protein n=1 Tax=Azorhizobium doebereinerae TaxID=281091 RepID=UPI00041C9A69|nr:FUSC family protein [Azorhizobium doebereinerae]